MKKISSISAKACLLVASVLCAIPAFPVFADPCNASKELDEQILKCGDNALAPKFGRECLTIIKNENEVALATLQKAQASRDRRKLEEAINNMFEQIKTMQSRTANVADYAGLMIDFPDSYRKETSVSVSIRTLTSCRKSSTTWTTRSFGLNGLTRHRKNFAIARQVRCYFFMMSAVGRAPRRRESSVEEDSTQKVVD